MIKSQNNIMEIQNQIILDTEKHKEEAQGERADMKRVWFLLGYNTNCNVSWDVFNLYRPGVGLINSQGV